MAEKQQKSSALPDVKELMGMLGKFFNDIKKSVTEICGEYKKKRETKPPKKED